LAHIVDRVTAYCRLIHRHFPVDILKASKAEKARSLANFRDVVVVSHEILRRFPANAILDNMSMLANASSKTDVFSQFVGRISYWWHIVEAETMPPLNQRGHGWAADAANRFW
jgi:hypothetical protein